MLRGEFSALKNLIYVYWVLMAKLKSLCIEERWDNNDKDMASSINLMGYSHYNGGF